MQYLTLDHGQKIAYHQYKGDKTNLPGIIFLGGFMSNMEGSKATFLEETCKARDQSYIRFDYLGHGRSDGIFQEGTIGIWMENALAVLDQLTTGPQILIGSSMGGWISMLLCLKRPERIAGFIGIAAAPDFTEEMQGELTPAQKQDLINNGLTYMPSDYDEPYPIAQALITDGKTHCLLQDNIDIQCPVRLLQGKLDKPVPWEKANRIKDKITHDDVTVTFIDDGDHSLSRPQDLEILKTQLKELSA